VPLSDDPGDFSLVANPVTGMFDLDWSGGNPAFDTSEGHTVLSLVLEWQARWWADSTGKRGSRLYTLRNDTSTTRTELIAMLQEALAPAVTDLRISNLVVTADRVAAGRYAFNLRWTNSNGQPGAVRVPPLPY
jgi:phage gp46-like protein